IEAHLVERCARRVRREMAADAAEEMIRAEHHDDRVPTNDPANTKLHGFVTGKRRLLLGRDRVDVARLDEPRQSDTELASALEDLAKQEVRALVSLIARYVIERLDPF